VPNIARIHGDSTPKKLYELDSEDDEVSDEEE
jgi:hypothetical protein